MINEKIGEANMLKNLQVDFLLKLIFIQQRKTQKKSKTRIFILIFAISSQFSKYFI